MAEIVRTTLAEWRQNPDGSWSPTVPTLGRSKKSGGNPDPGSDFLTPSEVIGGDNVEVLVVGDTVVIKRGGHVILFGGVPMAFRPDLDFQGNVSVVDDPASNRTIVEVLGSEPSMRWRGEYDPTAQYDTGDIVSYFDATTGGDAIFVWNETDQGFGFGLGPFGEGPFGGTEPAGGWGSDPFGEGPFGG